VILEVDTAGSRLTVASSQGAAIAGGIGITPLRALLETCRRNRVI